jgi:signal transduction histidine kinase
MFRDEATKRPHPEGNKVGDGDPTRLVSLLGERVRFETMLASLSAAFINLPATEVDGHIERGLQLVVEYLDIDRGSLGLFSGHGQELYVTHSYSRPSSPPYPKENIATLLPWYTGKMRQGEVLRFTRLPEELPPEAVHEREAFRQGNMPRSHLLIPFKVGHSVIGGICFGSFHRIYEWSDELVQSLKLAGEIFANAVARKQSEEKETRLRDQLILAGRVSLLGELSASIVHEVNQPLCAIISNAQTAQRLLNSDTLDRAELREALADITRDGQRASAVIAHIRGLLKRLPMQRAAIDLNELIREVCDLMRWEMNRRRIPVKLELADQLPAVRGDRVQLQQVLLNLMTNGADAMESVAPQKRELVLRSTVDGADKIVVAVKDSGTGIDPHNSERLFDSFFTTKPDGMGMGLAICKSILDAHGGDIWASANAEAGSTFQFTLIGIRESVA